MRKKILVILSILVTITSCSHNTFYKDRVKVIVDNQLFSNDKITKVDIEELLINQNEHIIELENKFGIKYDSILTIYLYDNKIGKKYFDLINGGFVERKNDKYIIRFVINYKRILDKNRNELDLIGMHETVHAVLFKCIGYSENSFINEGIATWIDGNYGIELKNNERIRNSIYSLQNNEIELSIAQILNNTHSEEIQYPQSGILFDWIYSKFGIEFIKQIYLLDKIEIIELLHERSEQEYIELEKEFEEFRNRNISYKNM